MARAAGTTRVAPGNSAVWLGSWMSEADSTDSDTVEGVKASDLEADGMVSNCEASKADVAESSALEGVKSGKEPEDDNAVGLITDRKSVVVTVHEGATSKVDEWLATWLEEEVTTLDELCDKEKLDELLVAWFEEDWEVEKELTTLDELRDEAGLDELVVVWLEEDWKVWDVDEEVTTLDELRDEDQEGVDELLAALLEDWEDWYVDKEVTTLDELRDEERLWLDCCDDEAV
ncbi:hypothetical protein FB451DRAFT_1165222 [Mycena latifolia]|nr:hypothetical protein FB451DRAFT_1165222 [Mycena latifolia]